MQQQRKPSGGWLIGQQLKFVREKVAGLTIEAAASRANLSEATIRKIEDGQGLFSSATAYALSLGRRIEVRGWRYSPKRTNHSGLAAELEISEAALMRAIRTLNSVESNGVDHVARDGTVVLRGEDLEVITAELLLSDTPEGHFELV